MLLSSYTRIPASSLLLSLFLLFPSDLRAGQGVAVEKKAAPAEPEKELSVKIDGKADDKAWETLPFRNVKYGTKDIKFKIHSDDAYAYLLVVFPSEKENRQHMPWRWDPLKQYYIVGPEREDELHVLWTEPPVSLKSDASPEKADVWIWRAGRTDPAGFADDYSMPGKNLADDKTGDGPAEFLPDQGLSCWFSRYFVSFTEDSVPRFYQRPPTGSAADVKAKGTWKEGVWTVEFCRKIKTGNPDDMDLSGKSNIGLSIFTGAPVKSRLSYSSFTSVPAAEDESK
ncbi:MAG TPA: hypothetical protein DET40_03650 [Lentisphaeria bacterium]|nr:MAG: hypothetical protein A2X45_23490 [Lentisphaerae bacterium GWF2_50_93]HCE42624.1 hypothetical protein [Lentisphaeria bacterium]